MLWFKKKVKDKDGNYRVDVKWRRDNSPSGKHPHIITDLSKDMYKSVSFTHSKKRGIPLEKNPLNKKSKSYIRKTPHLRPKKTYFGSSIGSLTPIDYNQIKKISNKK